MKRINIILAVFILSATFNKITAQTVQPYNEQINVVAPYEPSVSDANKINVNPDYVDIQLEKEKINYNTSSVFGNLPKRKAIGLDPLEPSKESALAKKHIFYGKFGFGTNLEPLADIYVNSPDSKKVGGGFHIKHHSAWRQMQDVYDNSFSNTDFDVYGKVKIKNSELQAKAFYAHNMFNYFGVSKADFDLAQNIYNIEDGLTKQKLHTYGGEISLANIKATKTYYSVLLNYTGFQFGENYVSNMISLPVNFSYYSKLFKKSKKEEFNLKFAANFDFSTHDVVEALEYQEKASRYIFSLEPTYSLQIGVFAFKLGLNTNFYNDVKMADSSFKANIHPVVEIKTTIIPEAFSFRVGITGESYMNSVKSLYNNSKYIRLPHHNVVDFMGVTNIKHNIYGFFDTRFGKSINFSTGVEIMRYAGMPCFSSGFGGIRIENSIHVLPIFYQTVDYKNFDKISISADLAIDIKENLSLNLLGKYNFINVADGVSRPCNIPEYEFYALAKYVLPNKKLSFGAQAILFGGAIDKNLSASPTYPSIIGPMPTIDLPLVYDLALTANYKIKSGIDVWANLNNLLHYKNKLYIYQLYPEYPANIMLGVTFSL